MTNYINDKLHSQMWASVYGEEQRLRREEGLPPLSVPWTDPRPSLDLIEHVRALPPMPHKTMLVVFLALQFWMSARTNSCLLQPSRGLFFLLDELRKQPALTDTTLYDTFNNVCIPPHCVLITYV